MVLAVQDWGGLLGLTLPIAAPERYRGLLVMNTALATGDAPLSPGFLAWREMCAKNPEFDVARLFARGNPQMTRRGMRGLQRALPRSRPSRGAAGVSAHGPRKDRMHDGAAVSRTAREFWSNQWDGQTMMADRRAGPGPGPSGDAGLARRHSRLPRTYGARQAGHFVQEHGEPIARAAVGYFRP